MKAIIITDQDAKALLDQLELASLKENNIMRRDPTNPPSVEEIHRAFHYVVYGWLRDQGADCARR
jgi:hypothetical protein